MAAPTVSGVSGTLSSGQTVTVRGSGFGSKSQPAPVLWDNFEGGSSGNQIQGANATIGRWDTGAGFELGINKTAAVLTILGSIAATAAMWFTILGVRS